MWLRNQLSYLQRAPASASICLSVFAGACSAGGGGGLQTPTAMPTTSTSVGAAGNSSALAKGVPIFSLPSDCSVSKVGAAPLTRLTTLEYQNSVTDLLAETAPSSALQIADTKVGAFYQNSELTLSETGAAQYLSAAEMLAKMVTQNWTQKSGCSALDDMACAEGYLVKLARVAFRGSMLDTDQQRIHNLLVNSSALSIEAKLEVAVSAILLSPKFLFTLASTTELGAANTANTSALLSPTELAGRVSLAFWKSTPDATLLDAFANAATPAAREALTRSMLEDPRATRMFKDFVGQWLGLENLAGLRKSPVLFPEFALIQRNLLQETQLFYSALLTESGDLTALLTAPFSFANQPLASLYGIPSAQTDPSLFVRVELPETRFGILTHASFLSQHAHPEKTSPVKRGLMLRERFLCDPVNPPPPGVQTQVDVGAGQSPSAAFMEHSKNPACASCHQFLDGLGQGFGQYDAIGRYVVTEPAVGEIAAPVLASNPDISGPFVGLRELTSKLAASRHVSQCYALEVLRYLMRHSEQAEDACALQSVYAGFEKSGGSLKELLVAAASSDLFLRRSVAVEALP